MAENDERVLDIKLFDDQGNFTILLKIQIIRYSKESGKTTHEVIELMKSLDAPIKTWIYWSFSGYESFKSKMEMIRAQNERSDDPCHG